MQEYVNGCYTKCGLRPINCMEIKYQEDLGHGFSFRCGVLPNPDGVSVDILKDGEVVAWEHGITLFNVSFKEMEERKDFSGLRSIAVSRIKQMYPEVEL